MKVKLQIKFSIDDVEKETEEVIIEDGKADVVYAALEGAAIKCSDVMLPEMKRHIHEAE